MKNPGINYYGRKSGALIALPGKRLAKTDAAQYCMLVAMYCGQTEGPTHMVSTYGETGTLYKAQGISFIAISRHFVR